MDFHSWHYGSHADPEVFISLIFNYLFTISYSILVNRVSYGLFKPERGVCQGDPLSPYLFLLCSEGLACLLKRSASLNRLHSHSASYHSPRISHRFFADYSLLFSQAFVSDCVEICSILKLHERVSRQ